MKKVIFSIVFLFVSFTSLFSQTSLGKDCKGREIFQGTRGGLYYLNTSGNKTYVQSVCGMDVAQKVSEVKVSVPTAAQTAVAKKSPVLIDNGDTATYYGVTFDVQTGSKGGRYIVVEKDGEVKKVYLHSK